VVARARTSLRRHADPATASLPDLFTFFGPAVSPDRSGGCGGQRTGPPGAELSDLMQYYCSGTSTHAANARCSGGADPATTIVSFSAVFDFSTFSVNCRRVFRD